MDLLIALLKPRGKLILLSLPPESQKFIASFWGIVINAIEIVGSLTGGHKDTERMLEVAAKHKVDPMCEFYDFWEFDRALERAEKNAARFKCVLCIDEASKKFN